MDESDESEIWVKSNQENWLYKRFFQMDALTGEEGTEEEDEDEEEEEAEEEEEEEEEEVNYPWK